MKYTLLSGGVRKNSSNKKLSNYVYSYLNSQDSIEVDLFDNLVKDVPFVSEAEQELPGILNPVRNSLITAEKVIVFSPILNGGYASSIKNALDWLSLSFDSYKYNDLYKDKKVAIICSVLGGGGNSLDARNMLSMQLEKYGFTTFNESYLFKNAEEQIIELKNKSSSPHKALTGFLNRFIEF